ncbi:MAG: hypothetical protein CSA42_07695 [Gammaproteobacteria bacterium]|nr:MAG: hypothetical protein CSA42_07695 [Gammaproteobacteria bacterium]
MGYQYFKTSLEHWLNQEGNSQKILQIQAGYKKARLSQILSQVLDKKHEKNNTPISYDNQVKIAYGCGYSYFDFLEYGKNLIDGKTPPPAEPRPIIIQSPQELTEKGLDTEAFIPIPLYESGKVAAFRNGSAFNPYEEATDHILIHVRELEGRSKHRLLALEVGGDSMEPLIPKGSIIVADTDDKEYIDNKVYVLKGYMDGVDNYVQIKRVRKADNIQTILLMSDNSKYPPIAGGKDWNALCVGRVFRLWRNSLDI